MRRLGSLLLIPCLLTDPLAAVAAEHSTQPAPHAHAFVTLQAIVPTLTWFQTPFNRLSALRYRLWPYRLAVRQRSDGALTVHWIARTDDEIRHGEPPRRNARENADRYPWVDLGQLVGLVQVRRNMPETRPNYQREWLDDPQGMTQAMASWAGRYAPATIEYHQTRQSKFAEQALSELVANGMDAIDAWISRFGLGFYQALGQVRSGKDRLLFAGETPGGERIGLIFRRSTQGRLETRALTSAELAEFLGDQQMTTRVELRRDLTGREQVALRDSLARAYDASRRMPIYLDGTPLNPLTGYRRPGSKDSLTHLNTARIHVHVTPQGYLVANPGVIEPAMLFERLIVPYDGRTPGIDRKPSRTSVPPPTELFYRTGAMDHERAQITVQVAGRGAETWTVPGLGLPEKTVIALPPEATINVSWQLSVDPVLLAAMQHIIDDLKGNANTAEVIAVCNALMTLWDALIGRGQPRERQWVEQMKEEQRDSLRRLIQENASMHPDLVLLPAREEFRHLILPGDTRHRVYVHPELIDFTGQGIPGLTPVHPFRAGSATQIMHAQFDAPLAAPLFHAGNMIIMETTLYERAQQNPWIRFLINWWMNFQVGYGEPLPSVGWWAPDTVAPAVESAKPLSPATPHAPRPEPTASDRSWEEDRQRLMDLLPSNWSPVEYELWTEWLTSRMWPQRGVRGDSYETLQNAVQEWVAWLAQFPEGKRAGAWECIVKSHMTLEDPFNLHPHFNGREDAPYVVFVLPDGRRMILAKDLKFHDSATLYIETAPNSGEFVIQSNETEDNDGVYQNLVPSSIDEKLENFSYQFADGRIYMTDQKQAMIETLPGSGRFHWLVEVHTQELDKIKAGKTIGVLPDGRFQVKGTMASNEVGLWREVAPRVRQWRRVPFPEPIDHLWFLPSGQAIAESAEGLYYYIEREPGDGDFIRVATERGVTPYSQPFIALSGGRILKMTGEGLAIWDSEDRVHAPAFKMVWRTTLLSGIDSIQELPDGRLRVNLKWDRAMEETRARSYVFRDAQPFHRPFTAMGFRFFNGAWLSDIETNRCNLWTVNWPLSPPSMTPADWETVRAFVKKNAFLFSGWEAASLRARVYQAVFRLGSAACDRLALFPYISIPAVSALEPDTRVLIENWMNRETLSQRLFYLGVIDHFHRLLGQDPARFNTTVRRWMYLLRSDTDRMVLRQLTVALQENEYRAAVHGGTVSDLKWVDPAWRPFFQYLSNDDALLPLRRPASEPDVFAAKPPLARFPTSSFRGTRPTLGLLLAFVRQAGNSLKGKEHAPLTLKSVLPLWTAWRGRLDADADATAINRTIRAQTDGFAIWIRELIQNARDELRRYGRAQEPVRISAWFENNDCVVQIADPVGMNLEKLLRVYFPINISDKKDAALTGKLGQGNYAVWQDATLVRLRTGDGTGYSYDVELAADRDAHGWPLRIRIAHFFEHDDGFQGTVIEHVRRYEPRDGTRLIDAVFLQHALHRLVGDVQPGDTPLLFQGEPFADTVQLSAAVHDARWGDFEVGTTNGVSRITHDGLEVRSLQDTDWEGVPTVVRTALEKSGTLLIRWPRGVPLTAPRNAEALQEMDPTRWHALRLTAFFQAAVENLQQRGVWIPDLPQDILSHKQKPSAGSVHDAARINAGDWAAVDWSRYERGDAALDLLMQLRGRTQPLSLMDLAEQLAKRPSDAEVRRLVEAFPGLQDRILNGMHRQSKGIDDILENLMGEQDHRRLDEAGFPHFAHLFDYLRHTLSDTGVEARIGTLRLESFAYVNAEKPLILRITAAWAMTAEKIAATLPRILMSFLERDIRSMFHVMDVLTHEYVHTEELREQGASSHLTHQRDGVLENSFLNRMRRVIERLLRAEMQMPGKYIPFRPLNGAA